MDYTKKIERAYKAIGRCQAQGFILDVSSRKEKVMWSTLTRWDLYQDHEKVLTFNNIDHLIMYIEGMYAGAVTCPK